MVRNLLELLPYVHLGPYSRIVYLDNSIEFFLKVIMCQPRDWNAGAFRKILHGEPTPFVPSSLFQLHPNATLYATNEAMRPTKPEIRVYNK